MRYSKTAGLTVAVLTIVAACSQQESSAPGDRPVVSGEPTAPTMTAPATTDTATSSAPSVEPVPAPPGAEPAGNSHNSQPPETSVGGEHREGDDQGGDEPDPQDHIPGVWPFDPVDEESEELGELVHNGGDGDLPDIVAPGLPAVSPPVVPDDPVIKAGRGCQVQCITSGIAYARGIGAELVVEADTPARIWIIVWNEDTGYHQLRESGAGSQTTTFTQLFDDLDPGTTYSALAAAEDQEGFTSHAWGEFETRVRNVNITFDDLIDREDWPRGTGPDGGRPLARYYPYVDGQHVPDGWLSGVPPIENSGRYLDLQFWATLHMDGDICEAIGPDGPHYLPDASGYDSIGCFYWTAAWYGGFFWDREPIDLDAAPADAAPSTGHTLELVLEPYPGPEALPSDVELKFRAPVTIEVIYARP